MHVADHLTLDELRGLADAATGKRRFLRIRAVILAAEGRTAPEVAAALGCSRRAAQGWVARYNDEGPAGFDERPRPGRPPFLTPRRPTGSAAASTPAPPPRTAPAPSAAPRSAPSSGREFGVTLQPAGRLRPAAPPRLLLPRPPAPPPQGRPRGAGGVQKKVAGQLDDIARDHPGERVEVWFEDEARFGQKGTLTTVWARRGSRPTAVRQTQYDYLWVIAAACPATGAAAGIIMPHLDTPTINLFLERVLAQLAPGVQAVLIWDSAGFHVERRAAWCRPNVSLIRLPPYSPELNPIENLWHYLRSHYWSNRVLRGLGGAEGGSRRGDGGRGHGRRADQVGLRRPLPRPPGKRMN